LSRVKVCGVSNREDFFEFGIESVVDLFVDHVIVYFSEFRKTERTFGVGSEIVGTASDPFVLTIGCHNGKPFVIDRHPVAPPFGNGNGLVLRENENTPEVCMSVCMWLWQRLYHGGVNTTTAQSLAVVTLDAK